MKTHEMIALIKVGKGKEHYKEWAKTGPREVRIALADARQMLDIPKSPNSAEWRHQSFIKLYKKS